MRKVPQPARLYMPPRLATVRYEDRVGHLTLSWATCCFSLFWRYSQLDWVYTWMLFLDGIWSWLYTPIALYYCISCELSSARHCIAKDHQGWSNLSPWPTRSGAEKSKFHQHRCSRGFDVGWNRLEIWTILQPHSFWIVDACNQLHHFPR